MARFIFITGGVVSSLGKGLMAASLAALLQGFRTHVNLIPYNAIGPALSGVRSLSVATFVALS